MLRFICAVLFAICFLILGIPVLGIEYLIGKKNPAKRDLSSLRIVQWAFRVICRICGVKLTVIGHEKVPADQPVLYAANHNSYFDIIISYALCPGLTGYIAKDDIEKVPLLNIWMRRLYCLFLKRGDMKQSLKVILKAIEYVKNGISICIFPEGTRGKDSSLGEFKEGSMKIAEKTGCPVIPVAISDTRRILLDHMPIVKPTHVILEYGDPIWPNELSREEKKALGAITHDVIAGILEKNRELL